MKIALVPEAVMAAAKHKDANTAERLKPLQDAVNALGALKGYGIFGSSPAGTSIGAVFAKISGVIDDYANLTKDNQDRVDNLGDTGIKPGDEAYVPPVSTDPATTPDSGSAPSTGTAPGSDPDTTGLPS